MGTKYSGLPGDRELGRMNRRHVLRALGLSATGAALAACGPGGGDVSDSTDMPADELGQTFPVVNVQHLSLAAADYVKSRDFYINVFGMKDAWDNGSGCALEFGSPACPTASTSARSGRVAKRASATSRLGYQTSQSIWMP